MNSQSSTLDQRLEPLIMIMGFIPSKYVSRFLCPWKVVSHRGKSPENKNWAFPEELCRRFSLDEIKAATRCFDDSLLIGQDGYAKVYKGYVNVDKNSTEVVAIKRFNRSTYSRRDEFRVEVQLLCQLRHPNLISLVGFCEEEGQYIIVHNYMPNGSLSSYLYPKNATNPQYRGPLLWKQRLEICIAMASAIHHLHTGVKYTIIHRHVNCANILLDDSLEPKLADFGLSETGPRSLSNALTKIMHSNVGARPYYLDPEYFSSLELSEKFDVYSFGGVLTEVLCGKQTYEILQEWRDRFRSLTLLDILDPFLVGRVAPDSLKRFKNIVARCVRARGVERPTMGEVQVELEYALALQERADTDKEREAAIASSVDYAGGYTYNDEASFNDIQDIFGFKKSVVPSSVDIPPMSPCSLSFSSCDEGR